MIDFVSVKEGKVNLADIVGINHYLDMKADIELATMQKAERKYRHGNR